MSFRVSNLFWYFISLFFRFFKNLKNNIGLLKRISKSTIGENVSFANGLHILGEGFLEIENDVRIGENVTLKLEGKNSKIILKSGCQLGDDVNVVCYDFGKIEIGKGSKIGQGGALRCNQKAIIFLDEFVYINNHVSISTNSVIKISKGSVIGTFTSIGPREINGSGEFVCGQNCHIHQYNFFDTTAKIELGDDVRTGPYDIFYTHDHDMDSNMLIWESPEESSPILVSNGAWIGCQAVILQGLAIGKGAVVGAGSVVTKSVDPYAIVGGVPARLIRHRKSI